MDNIDEVDENQESKEKDLKILIKLQAVDFELRDLKKSIELLPEEVNVQSESYNARLMELDAVKKEIDDCVKGSRQKERDISTENDNLGKLNTKLNGIKTNKEYAAVLSEIDDRKNKITGLEDEELVLMEKQEQLKTVLKEKNAAVLVEKQKLDEKRKRNLAELEKAKEQLIKDKEARKTLANSLDPPVYEEYRKIAEIRDGYVVAKYTNNMCGGCFQKLIPQNEVLLKRNTMLIKCSQCLRFLYCVEEDANKVD